MHHRLVMIMAYVTFTVTTRLDWLKFWLTLNGKQYPVDFGVRELGQSSVSYQTGSSFCPRIPYCGQQVIVIIHRFLQSMRSAAQTLWTLRSEIPDW